MDGDAKNVGEMTIINDDLNENYKPPPEKSIKELLASDQNDDSLRKYKETLLGSIDLNHIVFYPDDPRKVIVKRLKLLVVDRQDLELDLTINVAELKNKTFVLKEGISYRVKIEFIVQREIVHGLKYVQKTYRLGVPVDKVVYMVGSYAPKNEIQSYITVPEEAPSGMLTRGVYNVHSLFTDDDKNIHLKWEWNFEIKKDWKD